MLNLFKRPTISDQQKFLVKFLETYHTPAQFENFIVHAEAFKAKKGNRMVIQLTFNRSTPLAFIYEYVLWAMASLGGEIQHGPPPRGEAVRQIR